MTTVPQLFKTCRKKSEGKKPDDALEMLTMIFTVQLQIGKFNVTIVGNFFFTIYKTTEVSFFLVCSPTGQVNKMTLLRFVIYSPVVLYKKSCEWTRI